MWVPVFPWRLGGHVYQCYLFGAVSRVSWYWGEQRGRMEELCSETERGVITPNVTYLATMAAEWIPWIKHLICIVWILISQLGVWFHLSLFCEHPTKISHVLVHTDVNESADTRCRHWPVTGKYDVPVVCFQGHLITKNEEFAELFPCFGVRNPSPNL